MYLCTSLPVLHLVALMQSKIFWSLEMEHLFSLHLATLSTFGTCRGKSPPPPSSLGDMASRTSVNLFLTRVCALCLLCAHDVTMCIHVHVYVHAVQEGGGGISGVMGEEVWPRRGRCGLTPAHPYMQDGSHWQADWSQCWSECSCCSQQPFDHWISRQADQGTLYMDVDTCAEWSYVYMYMYM